MKNFLVGTTWAMFSVMGLFSAEMISADEVPPPEFADFGNRQVVLSPDGAITISPNVAKSGAASTKPADGKNNLVDGPSICDITISRFDTVDLHAQNVKVSTVLQELAVKSRRNIILAADSDRIVSATLYSSPFFDALGVLLDVNGLAFSQEDDFIKVFTKDQMKSRAQGKNGMESRAFSLNYLRAKDAKAAVAGLLSANGKAETITDDEAAGAASSGGGDVKSQTLKDDPVYSPDKQKFVYNNTLVVSDYRDNVASVAQLLAKLDKRPKQILIEATVMEVALNDNTSLGIDFSILESTGVLTKGSSTFNAGGNGDIHGGLGFSDGTFKGGFSLGNSFTGLISALDQVGNVSVLSSPKVMSLDRQRAKVFVGQSLAYIKYTVGEGGTLAPTIDWVDAGISLDVRPQVMEDGKIRLTALPKVVRSLPRKEMVKIGTGEIEMTIYDFDVQYVAADIMLPPGATAVIGGLFAEDTNTQKSQIPGVGDLPVVGNLAKKQNDINKRRELVFLIHPVVLSDNEIEQIGDDVAKGQTQVLAGVRQGLLPWSRTKQSESLALRSARFLYNQQRGLSDWTYRRAKNLDQKNYHSAGPELDWNGTGETGILRESIFRATAKNSDGKTSPKK